MLPEQVLGYLRERGLADTSLILADRLEVRDVSRRTRSFRVVVDGGWGWTVEQGSVLAELAAHPKLAGLHPHLPAVLHWDAADRVTVARVQPATALAELPMGEGTARLCGRLLAHVHRRRADLPELESTLAAAEAGPAAHLVHGDARWENFLVGAGNAEAWLVGWGAAHWGDPVQDVAAFLAGFERAPDPAALRAFLAGYAEAAA